MFKNINNKIHIGIVVIMIVSLLFLGSKVIESNEGFENNQRVIISLTTVPDRAYKIHQVVKHLASFSVVDKVILNAPDYSPRFEKSYEYPKDLKSEGKIHINKTNDYGPITKLLPAIIDNTGVSFTDDIIIILDDDINYTENGINNLIREKKKRPKDIICTKAWSYKKLGGVILPYFVFKGYSDVLQGYGAVAFERSMFEDDFKTYVESCHPKFKSVDDLVISAYVRKKGIKVFKIFKPMDTIPDFELQSSSLMFGNFVQGKQIDAIRELF